jgi:hypothetical protein
MPQFWSLAFLEPWILSALLVLPAIWWLLRAIPPAPRHEWFPPLRLMLGLQAAQQSPAHMPWWLLMLRMVIAAAAILGLSQPILNPAVQEKQGGLKIVVVDDGWAAGAQWPARRAALEALVGQAERNAQHVLILTTAMKANGEPARILTADTARAMASGFRPMPWHADRAAAARRLGELDFEGFRGNIASVWISDGLARPDDQEGARELGRRLAALGPLRILQDPAAQTPVILTRPEPVPDGFRLTGLRARGGRAQTVALQAVGEDGQILAVSRLDFGQADTQAVAQMTLPIEVRNMVTLIRMDGVRSAAAVWLLDESWRRRTVGIVSSSGMQTAQPLLDDQFYLQRAMTPFADIRKGAIGQLLETPLSILMLADIGRIVAEDRTRVEDWLDKGGMLVRFAGPRMMEQSDDLLPVRLRQVGRALGGALSWEAPAALAAFPENSPFYGLEIPGDITVSRQLLAEPENGLVERTWASLRDGTPLVTAARKGKGWIVLFHVTANTRWSSLPLSGLYVRMLQRIVEFSARTAEAPPEAQNKQAETLYARAILDGEGQLRAPFDDVLPYTPAKASPEIGPHHPPGYYGADSFRAALNLDRDAAHLQGLPELPGARVHDFAPEEEIGLSPWLLSFALVLLLIDGAVTLLLLRRLPGWKSLKTHAGMAPVILCVLLFSELISSAAAQPRAQTPAQNSGDDRLALEAALETRLAYIITGDAGLDAVSAAGLAGLTRVLRMRTAFEAAPPHGINPETEELVFYPLIYWPMTGKQLPLTDKALARIDAYMKNGGTILFDTRDQLTAFNLPRSAEDAAGPGETVLRRILGGLDIPPLAPLAEDHVLNKSFYLLRDFPGRYSGGRIWVTASANSYMDANSVDVVSSILIGANDWAAAWAVDGSGEPLMNIGSGGARQRELAYRAGVNLVMYALTGNYKADQVHMPALLERLGQ